VRAPIKTDKVLRMKESYNEVLARHVGPESCVMIGNNHGEALTGVRTGRVLSPEITGIHSSADVVQEYRRPHHIHRYGKMYMDSTGSETSCMYGNTLYGNRDTLCLSLFDGIKERMENPNGVLT
jgi:hypothetical protein